MYNLYIIIGRMRKDTQCCVLDCSTCYYSQCNTKVEEDGQQIETTMVPTTFTKHLVTIAAKMTKSKGLEE